LTLIFSPISLIRRQKGAKGWLRCAPGKVTANHRLTARDWDRLWLWCTRLPGCIRLRNDLYCVGWGVKLLTHSLWLWLIICEWTVDLPFAATAWSLRLQLWINYRN